MNAFHYHNGQLHCEQIPLDTIAASHGTPSYVYSRAALSRNFMAYKNAIDDINGLICYAVKANSNIAVLQTLAHLGAGFDIVSIGELERVIKAGGNPENVVFSGVAKTADEMQQALTHGVHCFNIESLAELKRLNQVALSMNRRAPASIRVNPDVDANTHPYISTGLKENKFGIDIESAINVYQQAAQMPGIHICGIDCHIGSQLTSVAPFLAALDRVLRLVDRLLDVGINIEHLDLGGGLGVTYSNETPPAIDDYINEIKSRLSGRSLSLILEPGRSIAANAGVLLTQVEYLKPTAHKNFAIIDAGMNDNIRPALYQAWQAVLPLHEQNDTDTLIWDLVGPVCETGDFLAKDRRLSLNPGDYLALMSAGAYGFTMSSNYNSRGRPPEIMIDGDTAHLIRERETINDLIRGESLLDQGLLKPR
ncbi:MAG: diaminopimelate decarboxylase [Cellvibrionaceae bacterium]|nr:diaminopimelate decarboxylase [Cellvibrionaceae bacterium]